MAFIKRQPKDDAVYLYLVEEGYDQEAKRGKQRYLKSLGKEQPISESQFSSRKAIVWASGRTLGNIAVFSEAVLGNFPKEGSGEDATLPCDIVSAGKYRNGKPRWWCRTHQVHWGTKADLQALMASPEEKIVCSNATHPMNYVIDPFLLNPRDYLGGIGVWVSLPPAINTTGKREYKVNVHVHARSEADGKKLIDRDYKAIQFAISTDSLFDNADLMDKINITPPAAWSFVMAFEEGLPLDCLSCHYCGTPHLDLGDFALNPHRKHFCANCGQDSNWSSEAIVSNPLKRVFDRVTVNKEFSTPERCLNLDEYSDHKYEIWSSTPALVWTLDRPQEKGIHVHIYDSTGKRVIDDTFGEVILNGISLERKELLRKMIEAASNPVTKLQNPPVPEALTT
jgi:hypothetical protein